MRELLFRGKRTDNGEWVKGKGVDVNFDNAYILTKEYDCGYGYYGGEVEVVPETVGQFSGIPDKNGTPIFEGDLLESRMSENTEDWKVWVVGFEDGTFLFESVRKSVKSRRKYRHEVNMLCADEIKFYSLVLIGNVHDNPELLEAQNDD